MIPVTCDLIKPLGVAEHRFLQVLLSRFRLTRKSDGGAELEVLFDQTTPAIWTREAKDEILRRIPRFRQRAKKSQRELDSFLHAGKGTTYEFNQPDFPFRYASGGTLPVMRLGNRDYYCLFYREIFPVGWNIANGGCDTLDELLNPVDTIDRELREELIVIDPRNKRRYVFEGDADKPLDRPEFAVARRVLQQHFPDLDLPNLKEFVIPLTWIEGPDSVRINTGSLPVSETRPVSDCFLNINAEDFGIEVDRVAKIHLADEAVLVDGELLGNFPVNAPIGLFDAAKINSRRIARAKEFVPDVLFFGGEQFRPCTRRVLTKCVERFIRHIGGQHPRRVMKAWQKCKHRFGLCPVTRGILRRYLPLATRPKAPVPRDVPGFISCGGEDHKIAQKVHDFLADQGIRTFFYQESNEPVIVDAVLNALDRAKFVIVVGTRASNIKRRWPAFEYRTFLSDILGKRRGKRTIFPFVSFDPGELPKPLCLYDAVRFAKTRPANGLATLLRRVLNWLSDIA